MSTDDAWFSLGDLSRLRACKLRHLSAHLLRNHRTRVGGKKFAGLQETLGVGRATVKGVSQQPLVEFQEGK